MRRELQEYDEMFSKGETEAPEIPGKDNTLSLGWRNSLGWSQEIRIFKYHLYLVQHHSRKFLGKNIGWWGFMLDREITCLYTSIRYTKTLNVISYKLKFPKHFKCPHVSPTLCAVQNNIKTKFLIISVKFI